LPRIRTIKPEFPQSESMGRVSREARLCFILLWTLADDSGRLRGNSRMLASLLYPYDVDAGTLIIDWIGELEREGCVTVYRIASDHYIQILNWLKHQKIDKPSQSKIPEFREEYRILANPREHSLLDQGSRKGSEDQGKELKPAARRARGVVNNSQRAKATGETRHERIHQIIMGWYQEWAGVECPWNGAEGKQLKSILDATPNWPDQQIITCLDNLAKSPECISRGSPAHEWLNKIPKFLHGPLDRYWKPISNGANSNGSGGSKSDDRSRRIREKTERAFGISPNNPGNLPSRSIGCGTGDLVGNATGLSDDRDSIGNGQSNAPSTKV